MKIALCVFVFPWVVGCASQSTLVSGKLVSHTTGRPLEKAQVEVSSKPRVNITETVIARGATDSTGVFYIEIPPEAASSLLVSAVHISHEPVLIEIPDNEAGGHVSLGVVELQEIFNRRSERSMTRVRKEIGLE